jgi:hypothetical protein
MKTNENKLHGGGGGGEKTLPVLFLGQSTKSLAANSFSTHKIRSPMLFCAFFCCSQVI